MFLALLLACIVPPLDGPLLEDRVDVVEVNHFYDDNGRHVFDQLIFYDWDPEAARYQLRAWRLLKVPSQWPIRCRACCELIAVWFDGEHLRRVRAGSFRETWSQHDPELLERSIRPKEERPELCRPRQPLPHMHVQPR